MGSPENREPSRERALGEIESSVTDFFRAGRNWTREFARGFGGGLPVIPFGVLRYIRSHGPVRPGDIADAFDMDKASVSRQLTLLRERGYIEQRADPDDRRAVWIETSGAADAIFDELKQKIRASYGTMFADWDDDELASFAVQLSRFARSLP